MAQYDITPINAINTIVEIKAPHTSTEWEQLGGTTSYSDSGGEASTTELTHMGGSTIQLTARPGGCTFTVAVSIYQPWSDLSERIKDAQASVRPRTLIGVRLRTLEEVLYETSAGTAAIDTTGAVTFASADGLDDMLGTEDIGNGAILKIGSSRYEMFIGAGNAVTVKDVTTGAAPTTDVAAAAFSIVVPETTRTLPAVTVMDWGNIEVGADGTFTSNLSGSIKGQFPKAVVV